MIKSYISKVNKYYDKLRQDAQSQYNKNKEYAYTKFPIIKKCQDEINLKYSSLTLSLISNPSFSEIELNNMKKDIQNLRAKVLETLVENNLPINFLNMTYSCPICQDTGFIPSGRCQCYRKVLAKIYLEESELKTLIAKHNFNKFDFNLFPKHMDEKEGKSPRTNIRAIRNEVNSYVENFENISDNLFFYGPVGCGKSFMSYCIANEILNKGYLVIYKSSMDLFNDLRTIRTQNDKMLEDMIYNCDLLIIDDFGIEPINEYTSLDLFNLLNKKILDGKKILISTNLTLENIVQNYQERISSRLMGNFKFHRFIGEDLRIELNNRKTKKSKDNL